MKISYNHNCVGVMISHTGSQHVLDFAVCFSLFTKPITGGMRRFFPAIGWTVGGALAPAPSPLWCMGSFTMFRIGGRHLITMDGTRYNARNAA